MLLWFDCHINLFTTFLISLENAMAKKGANSFWGGGCWEHNLKHSVLVLLFFYVVVCQDFRKVSFSQHASCSVNIKCIVEVKKKKSRLYLLMFVVLYSNKNHLAASPNAVRAWWSVLWRWTKNAHWEVTSFHVCIINILPSFNSCWFEKN